MTLRLIGFTSLLIAILCIIINNISITYGALGDRLKQKESRSKSKSDDSSDNNNNNRGDGKGSGNYYGIEPTSEPTEEPTEPSKFTCCSCTRWYNDETAGYNACDDKLCVDMITVDQDYHSCIFWQWDTTCADAAQCICDGMDYNCNKDDYDYDNDDDSGDDRD